MGGIHGAKAVLYTSQEAHNLLSCCLKTATFMSDKDLYGIENSQFPDSVFLALKPISLVDLVSVFTSSLTLVISCTNCIGPSLQFLTQPND